MNGKKVAQVGSGDTRIHLSGTNVPGGAAHRWTVAILPAPSATFQPSHLLDHRSYNHRRHPSPRAENTDGRVALSLSITLQAGCLFSLFSLVQSGDMLPIHLLICWQ